MTPTPLAAVVDACRPLKFAPLPDLRLPGLEAPVERMRTDQWHRADLLAAEGSFPVLFDRLRSHHGPGHLLPAATNFLRVSLREYIFLVSASIYLTGRAPLLRADHLWLPWLEEESRFGTPALTTGRVAVLSEDPAAEHPDALTAPGEAELHRMAARSLVEAFTPLVEAVHAHTRVGLRTLWGWILDTLHFYMLNPARFLGHDAEAAWEQASRLGEALVEAGALTRKRPRLFLFAPDHPRGTWAVRGTCCFDYKGDPEHGYCNTCPLKSDAERKEILSGWLRDPALAP